MTEFGKRLKEERVKKGWNQEELAEKMGLKQASISQFEKGTRLPTPANVTKFCQILGIPRENLAGESNGRFEKEMLMRNIQNISNESLKKINEYAELLKDKEIKQKDIEK